MVELDTNAETYIGCGARSPAATIKQAHTNMSQLSERQLGGNAVPAIPSLPGLPVRRSVAAPAPSANPDADAFALDSGLPASMSLPQASQSLPANHAGHGLLPAIPKIPLRRAAETASAEATSSSAGGLLGGIPGLGNLPVRREATRTITGHSPETSAAGLIPGLDDLPIRRDAQGDLGLGAIDSLPINNLAGKADSASSVSLGGSMQGVSISTVPALPLRREASATASSKAATSSAAGALGGLPGMGSLPGLDSLNKLDNLRREPSPASSSAASTTSAAGMLGGLGLNKILGGAGGLKRDVVPTMTFPVHTIDAAVMQSLQNSNRVAPTGAPAHGQHNAHGQHLPRAAATSSSAATTSSAAAGMLGGLGLDKILGGVKRDDESGMEAAVMQSIWDRQSKMEHKTATGTASATASGAAGFGALTEGLQNGAGQIQHNLPVRRDAEEKPSPAKKAEASTSSAPTASASADKKEGLDGILGMLGMGGDKKGDESAASTSSMSGSTTASAPATSSSASKAAGLGGVLGGIRRDAPITQKPEGSATASAKVSMVTQTDNPSGFFGQGLTGVTSGNLMDSLSPDSLPNVDSVGAGAAPLPIRARDEGEKKHGEEATASKTVSAVPSATSAAGGLGSLNDILGGLRKRQGYGLDKLDKVEDLTSVSRDDNI